MENGFAVPVFDEQDTDENELAVLTDEQESNAIKIDNRHNNKGRNPKIYNIHTNNTIYLEYLTTMPETTAYQYGLTVKKFLESLGQKTPKRVTLGEVETFVNGKDIVNNHLRSFYKWAVKNNIGDTADDIQRSVLIWLV